MTDEVASDDVDGAPGQDAGGDSPPPTPEPALADSQAEASPPVAGAGGAAPHLRAYARRLEREGEQGLAGAVREYAERVGAVGRGELPAALGVAPAAISPTMVGAVLVRPGLERFLEFFRNVLVFLPVLWTWLKLSASVSAYPPDAGTNFFDFWVQTGGSAPVVGGTLADAALQVAVILVLLVVVNALLGMLRARTEGRREAEARRFAAALARAEAAGADGRAGDPAAGARGLAAAATGAEPGRAGGQPVTGTSEAVAGQQRRLDDVIDQLRGIAAMGDQLAALRTEFSEAREAAERSARTLTEIRESLDPSARDFADAAETLTQLATHVERMSAAMASAIGGLDSGLESSAEHLREAATSMNTVATRVLDELHDGRGGGR